MLEELTKTKLSDQTSLLVPTPDTRASLTFQRNVRVCFAQEAVLTNLQRRCQMLPLTSLWDVRVSVTRQLRSVNQVNKNVIELLTSSSNIFKEDVSEAIHNTPDTP